MLPEGHQAVFEFRNDSWFDDDVYAALQAAGAALCLSEREDNAPPPLVETAPWGYLRLRLENYSEDDLSQWVHRLAATRWQESHVYFMHETDGTRLCGDLAASECGFEERAMTTPTRIDLAEKLATFIEPWQPRVVGQFNGHDLMVAKIKGEFVWHKHDDTDDFFLVLQGSVTIQMRDGDVTLGPGELFVVPKGVEHRPVAEEEADILLIEQSGTPNTGDAGDGGPAPRNLDGNRHTWWHPPAMNDSLQGLARQLDRFAEERDWKQFHSPKNLASALIVEAGELLEHFQWMTEAQSRELSPEQLETVGAEIADVLLYLIQLADALGIDPVAAARAKLQVNESKYPVDSARGSSRKYDKL